MADKKFKLNDEDAVELICHDLMLEDQSNFSSDFIDEVLKVVDKIREAI